MRRQRKSHPVTRLACALGATSLFTLWHQSSLFEHQVSLLGLFPALAAIGFGFAGFVLSHAQPRRYETSETRIALATASLTIIVTLGCTVLLDNWTRIVTFVDEGGIEQSRPIARGERPSWVGQPKNPYRIDRSSLSNLY
jgi:hypothetical protein